MAVMKATNRTETGSKRMSHLRKAGRVPGIVYGHGQPAVQISLDLHDLAVAIKHGDRILELQMDDKTETALIKEVQYDALGNELLHIDLARVDLDERVKVTVPIVLRGTPAGALEGGVLSQVHAEVEIECTVRSIPDDIRYSVTAMKVDDVLRLKDLVLPEGAKLMEDPEAIVASVSVVSEEELAPAQEGPAQPEVIGEKKEEGEEGAA